MNNISVAAEQFRPHGRVIDIREFGNGNINNTFLVTLHSSSEKHFILQRINTLVFRQPEFVMLNIRIATEHVGRRLNLTPPFSARRWEVPRVFLTHDGKDHWNDPEGSFWRAISFIEGARSFETIRDIHQAKEVGHALGMFHTLLSDLPPERLTDTLEGFHIAPDYLRHYDEVLARHRESGSSKVNYCLEFIKKRRSLANVLENVKAQGRLLLRPIHGDPKVNNIMMDIATGQAISIVDLDTVKPGLVHYDIGDCLRSGCNAMGEETKKWREIHFDLDLCRAILKGYLSIAREFLSADDFYYLYDSVRLIAFELGLRFFTDYLEGDVYFKVRYPGHNLARALVQFRLTESIEAQETAIRGIIRDLA